MIATIVNACAVLIGSLLGLLLRSRIRDSFKSIVQIGAGVTSLIIGIKMALTGQKIVYLALSLIIGGILGEWWRIEDGILALGETLKRTFRQSGPPQVRQSADAGREQWPRPAASSATAFSTHRCFSAWERWRSSGHSRPVRRATTS